MHEEYLPRSFIPFPEYFSGFCDKGLMDLWARLLRVMFKDLSIDSSQLSEFAEQKILKTTNSAFLRKNGNLQRPFY
jgi:hypothetical protein